MHAESQAGRGDSEPDNSLEKSTKRQCIALTRDVTQAGKCHPNMHQAPGLSPNSTFPVHGSAHLQPQNVGGGDWRIRGARSPSTNMFRANLGHRRLCVKTNKKKRANVSSSWRQRGECDDPRAYWPSWKPSQNRLLGDADLQPFSASLWSHFSTLVIQLIHRSLKLESKQSNAEALSPQGPWAEHLTNAFLFIPTRAQSTFLLFKGNITKTKIFKAHSK